LLMHPFPTATQVPPLSIISMSFWSDRKFLTILVVLWDLEEIMFDCFLGHTNTHGNSQDHSLMI
jgi:hypothetical protein